MSAEAPRSPTEARSAPARSLVARVAWGAALSASAAALIAALATGVFAAFLVRDAEDRRLEEAATTLASELEHDLHHKTVAEIVESESQELQHTGMRFAVYDDDLRLVAGDARLLPPATARCASAYEDTLRLCAAPADSGHTAVAAAAHASPAPLLGLAALVAAVLAALLAWLASRPVSRRVVAPLSRLRARIAALSPDALRGADLGPPEQVAEVDALRDSIGGLVQRVNEALEQAHRFAANAAHELRTPLTSVRAELELLAERLGPAPDGGVFPAGDAQADAQRALHTVGELGVLVERLLILAVPQRAPADAHEIVSIRDLVEDGIAALPAADRPRVEATEADAQVRGDAVLLGTLVANALSNALKFGQVVRVSVEVGGDAVCLHIEDDGPGIEPGEHARVFEPFYRSPAALRRRQPGHGLGLALIRHIAQAHGGTAALRTDAQAGAHLEVRLPLA